jgi:archaellin
MWKIFVAFVIFAAVALTVVFKMGDSIDMQGEAGGHDITESHADVKPAQEAPVAGTADATPAATTDTEKK